MRVFLVEDNDSFRAELARLISALPDTVVVHAAASDREAVDWLAAHPDGWDLVVIDIFLKNGHGFNVLKHCAGRTDAQRAIMLSNYIEHPARQNAAGAGADAFFDKTLEIDLLIAYCRTFAEKIRADAMIGGKTRIPLD